ncbi:hypothetical protein BGX38DRAFT_761272 [Terfezia claveryi]|nr:hypothetical protein BGX38DRAFT_761272 [Terfezia claveryi]
MDLLYDCVPRGWGRYKLCYPWWLLTTFRAGISGGLTASGIWRVSEFLYHCRMLPIPPANPTRVAITRLVSSLYYLFSHSFSSLSSFYFVRLICITCFLILFPLFIILPCHADTFSSCILRYWVNVVSYLVNLVMEILRQTQYIFATLEDNRNSTS